MRMVKIVGQGQISNWINLDAVTRATAEVDRGKVVLHLFAGDSGTTDVTDLGQVQELANILGIEDLPAVPAKP